MIELDRGHVVAVASIAGHQGVANMTDYWQVFCYVISTLIFQRNVLTLSNTSSSYQCDFKSAMCEIQSLEFDSSAELLLPMLLWER